MKDELTVNMVPQEIWERKVKEGIQFVEIWGMSK